MTHTCRAWHVYGDEMAWTEVADAVMSTALDQAALRAVVEWETVAKLADSIGWDRPPTIVSTTTPRGVVRPVMVTWSTT